MQSVRLGAGRAVPTRVYEVRALGEGDLSDTLVVDRHRRADALIAAVSLIGLGLPQEHSATLSRDLPVGVAEVWARITDLDDFARWRPDVDEVELIERPSNMLPAWRERGGRGVLALEATVAEPLSRLVLEIMDEGQPFGGSWTYRLDPTGSGTRLTITENGEIYSPVFRFVAKFVLGYEGTIRNYLDALEADFEASLAP